MKNIIGQPTCKISVLAGNIGDSFIKLYQFQHPDYQQNIFTCPYIGFSFEANARFTHAWISSTDKSFPLYKGDIIRLKLEYNKYLQLTFPIGGQHEGLEKRNIVPISDFEAVQLIEHPILDVEVSNQKTGIASIYKFSRKSNNQYSGEIQGSKLLQIAIKRIIGARQILKSFHGNE